MRSTRALFHIQSFEVSNLKALSKMTQLPLVQLIDASGTPYDFVVKHDPRTYADIITPAGLEVGYLRPDRWSGQDAPRYAPQRQEARRANLTHVA